MTDVLINQSLKYQLIIVMKAESFISPKFKIYNIVSPKFILFKFISPKSFIL